VSLEIEVAAMTKLFQINLTMDFWRISYR